MSPYSIEFPACPEIQGHWLMIAPVISTAHVSRQDYERLASVASDLPICIAQMHEDVGGHLLCIDGIDGTDIANELPSLSSGFHSLLLAFQDLGYAYIRFDPAGDKVNGLPDYDW